MRVYSIEQAKKLVPELARILIQMQEAARGIAEIEGRLNEARPGTAEHRALQTELQFLKNSYEADRRWLEAQGVILRDLEEGVVDIPARHEGELVYLTWKLGESAPSAWHAMTEDPSERHPL